MYGLEKELYEQILVLKQDYKLEGIKAEFEAEGSQFNDLVRLRRLTSAVCHLPSAVCRLPSDQIHPRRLNHHSISPLRASMTPSTHQNCIVSPPGKCGSPTFMP